MICTCNNIITLVNKVCTVKLSKYMNQQYSYLSQNMKCDFLVSLTIKYSDVVFKGNLAWPLCQFEVVPYGRVCLYNYLKNYNAWITKTALKQIIVTITNVYYWCSLKLTISSSRVEERTWKNSWASCKGKSNSLKLQELSFPKTNKRKREERRDGRKQNKVQTISKKKTTLIIM